MERESASYVPLQYPSPFYSTSTMQECFKPRYKPRCLKNKGAILVLVCNYLITSLLHVLLYTINRGHQYESIAYLLSFGLTLPIAGWLADARIGRYRVIRCSIWIMWIATVLATASLVMAQLVDEYFNINTKILIVPLSLAAIGLGGYQANIIQFGLDQLYDASTTEIKSFIVWYAWTLLSSNFIADYIFACLSNKYKAVLLLTVCVDVSLAIILLFFQNHWLIKEEPLKRNAIKQVYRVIKYAIKTKRPRQRGAFTYCEDELPSRIDFGMDKYGGPFTIEQVEDVKTCLRLIPIAIVGGTLAGSVTIASYVRNRLSTTFTTLDEVHLDDESGSKTKCYSEASFTHTAYYGAALLIIFHECLLYPIFHRIKCYPHIQSLHKCLMGVVLQILRVSLLLVFEVVSRHNFIQSSSHNTTIACLFHASHGSLSKSFDFRWMMIPDFLESVSLTMIYIGTFEFLSAQVPYFMKGLMVGVILCSLFFSATVWFTLSIPFTKRLPTWGTGTISCGFWYTFLLITTQICCFVILIMLTRWYKKRKRQDVLPNEHIFAERYYSY